MMPYEISDLLALLRLPSHHRYLVETLGAELERLERIEQLGFVEILDAGISVMFTEASLLFPEAELCDPTELFVTAIHLHREGHEGYRAFTGRLLADVQFNDARATIVTKLGEPLREGGGHRVPDGRIPRWMKYVFNGKVFHFQLDENARAEMLTLLCLEDEPNP